MTVDREHDRLRENLGAYALGGLSSAEERELSEHLADCGRCASELAELRELVGALSGVDPDEQVPQVPSHVDDRVEETLQRLAAGEPAPGRSAPTAISGGSQRGTAGGGRRSGRTLAVAAAAAVLGAAAATAVTLVVTADDAAPSPVVAAETVDVRIADAAINARAELVDHTWGMEIEIVGTGFVAGQTYEVVVTDRSGRTFTSGAFVGVGDDRLTCEMNSAVLRDQAMAFDVVDASGEVVVTADLMG